VLESELVGGLLAPDLDRNLLHDCSRRPAGRAALPPFVQSALPIRQDAESQPAARQRGRQVQRRGSHRRSAEGARAQDRGTWHCAALADRWLSSRCE
jgi:hypothetical protein